MSSTSTPNNRPDASPRTALARMGLESRTAVGALRTLGVWAEDGPVEPRVGLDAVLEALAASANPDVALRALERLAERSPQSWEQVKGRPELLARTAVVAGASEALGDLVARDPEAFAVLLGELEPWSSQQVRAGALEAVAAAVAVEDDAGVAHALARAHRRGLLRVAARDLLGMETTPTVAGELSALAEGILAAGLELTERQLQPLEVTVAVVAMGKLGGQELNYVSDVDVIFVHDGDMSDALRTCEALLRLLGRMTPAGPVLDVDANLRPEGRDGPLSRSLDAYVAYYERWAKTWEFQALLKARPVAGDAALGAHFSRRTEPFVWPDRLEPEAVAEIQRMKGVVESSKAVRRDGSRQLKLAPGGLRDIEFAVQLLQLVHGRHDHSLRSRSTLGALAALAEGGYVGEEDAESFAEAYVFLRTAEHRLQLAKLQRTHTLPRSDELRRQLARTMGFRGTGETGPLEQFDAEYRGVQALVRTLHEKLFFRPLLARFAQISAADLQPLRDAGNGGAGAGPGFDERAARERLMALGFRDPAAALRHIDALASGLSRRARLFATLLPAVLPTLAAAPDPDGGLAGLRSLTERLEDSPTYLRTLRDSPPVAELLARVLGRSGLVGRWLQRQPEVIGLLAETAGLETVSTAQDYRRLADGLLRRGEAQQEATGGLQRLRRREAVRIAVRDLAGLADVDDVATELTGLAEACLEAGVGVVLADGGTGTAGDLRVAVIGMGKLGGTELGWPSDLDVLLVHSGESQRDEALRAAEQLLKVLRDITPEGKAFRVDTALRPEGKDGPLIRSLDSYRSYYERWAEPWELQALTQARPVAGDPQLGAAFMEAIAQVVYTESPPADRLQAVRRMKARVERERSRGGEPSPAARLRPPSVRSLGPGPRLGTVRGRPTAGRVSTGVRAGDRIDLKLGVGGLADIEWTAQLLLLEHGGREPGLRVPGTRAALEALGRTELLTDEQARWLLEGHRLLSRLRNASYLAGTGDPSMLPPGADQQERLARMLGYPAPGQQALLQDLSRSMRRVRRVHEAAFYGR